MKEKKEFNLVFVGHVDTRPDWIDVVHKIVRQRVHLHIYGKTAYLSNKELKTKVGKAYKEILNHPFLHLHKPVPQKELAKEISKYDWGIWVAYPHPTELKSITMATGNKYASYLEAGLPTLYFKNHIFLDNLIGKDHKTGLGLRYEDLDNLRDILLDYPAEQFNKSIKAARKKYSMEMHIEGFENFLEEATEKKQLDLKWRRNLPLHKKISLRLHEFLDTVRVFNPNSI